MTEPLFSEITVVSDGPGPPRVFGSDTEGSPIILVHLSTQEQDQTLEPRPLIVPRREVAKRAELDASQRCSRQVTAG